MFTIIYNKKTNFWQIYRKIIDVHQIKEKLKKDSLFLLDFNLPPF
jgi:hypothetical protein